MTAPRPLGTAWLLAYRGAVRRALTAAALLLVALAVVLALRTPVAERRLYWLLYAAPAFAAVPLWLRRRLDALPALTWTERVLDGLVCLAAFARLIDVGTLAVSGQTLFLAHATLTVRSRAWRAFALVLLADTTWFKLALWHDPRSWLLGLLAGVVTGATSLAASHAHRLA